MAEAVIEAAMVERTCGEPATLNRRNAGSSRWRRARETVGKASAAKTSRTEATAAKTATATTAQATAATMSSASASASATRQSHVRRQHANRCHRAQRDHCFPQHVTLLGDNPAPQTKTRSPRSSFLDLTMIASKCRTVGLTSARLARDRREAQCKTLGVADRKLKAALGNRSEPEAVR
jgi:hypothetical protein